MLCYVIDRSTYQKKLLLRTFNMFWIVVSKSRRWLVVDSAAAEVGEARCVTSPAAYRRLWWPAHDDEIRRAGTGSRLAAGRRRPRLAAPDSRGSVARPRRPRRRTTPAAGPARSADDDETVQRTGNSRRPAAELRRAKLPRSRSASLSSSSLSYNRRIPLCDAWNFIIEKKWFPGLFTGDT